MDQATLQRASDDLLPELVAMRRDIHAEPELGLENPATQERILAALDGLGFDLATGSATTSVIADRGDPDGPTILLRADTDALPMSEESGEDFTSRIDGRAHACGHDAHVAMLLGAARVMAAHDLPGSGRIRLAFQPGEEGHGGAAVMIDEGLLDGVDAAFALHVSPNIPSGWFASRPGPLLSAGTTTNVIPERARVEGTIRAISESTRAAVHEEVRRIAHHVAAAHDCTVEVELRPGYPVTVNDGEFAPWAAGVASAQLGQGRVVEMPTPIMGAEDFSYVLQRVPGAMAFLGACPTDVVEPLEAPSCHSNRMRIDEQAMAAGVACHVAVATTYLEQRS